MGGVVSFGKIRPGETHRERDTREDINEPVILSSWPLGWGSKLKEDQERQEGINA